MVFLCMPVPAETSSTNIHYAEKDFKSYVFFDRLSSTFSIFTTHNIQSIYDLHLCELAKFFFKGIRKELHCNLPVQFFDAFDAPIYNTRRASLQFIPLCCVEDVVSATHYITDVLHLQISSSVLIKNSRYPFWLVVRHRTSNAIFTKPCYNPCVWLAPGRWDGGLLRGAHEALRDKQGFTVEGGLDYSDFCDRISSSSDRQCRQCRHVSPRVVKCRHRSVCVHTYLAALYICSIHLYIWWIESIYQLCRETFAAMHVRAGNRFRFSNNSLCCGHDNEHAHIVH